MKRFIALFAVLTLSLSLGIHSYATETKGIYPVEYEELQGWTEKDVADSAETAALSGDFKAKATLLMEASTGKILHADNENEKLPIASVTKIMVTLLICEAIDSGKIALSDMVSVSEYASSMGGSQVYLEPGEQMSVDELLKCLIVVSANDASVALAEHIYGSEESFINAMNDRAAALGMKNTSFVNTTGLDTEGHYSSALDVALMTRELLKHEVVFNYTTIWMDTIRDGAFGLSNTNKLIRFYNGANGMKTGFTTDAMYCLSGTALRDGMQLIAVVLGGTSSDDRFAAAKKMLDFGFANYRVIVPESEPLQPLPVKGATVSTVELEYTAPSLLAEKGVGTIEKKITLPENLKAPLSAGDEVGRVSFVIGDSEIASVPIVCKTEAKPITFASLLGKIWEKITSFI